MDSLWLKVDIIMVDRFSSYSRPMVDVGAVLVVGVVLLVGGEAEAGTMSCECDTLGSFQCRTTLLSTHIDAVAEHELSCYLNL